jgi:hypothetical protein
MTGLTYMFRDRVILLLVVATLALVAACSSGAPAAAPSAAPTALLTELPATPAPTPELTATRLPVVVSPTATVATTTRHATPTSVPTPTPLPLTSIAVPTATASPTLTVDITRLPMGDGRVSTRALSGNVWSCQTTFQDRRIHEGPWLNGDGTFDYTKKVVVEGSVNWPSSFDVMVNGDVRALVGNSLPSHPTGEFPIDRQSKAYSYDQPSCLRMGPIGVMLTGGLFFNALDAAGVDAVAHEVRDACDGHPQGQGQYHYHNLTPCVNDVEVGHSELMGHAFDGFGIYGMRGEDGQLLTKDDLGDCHGHTHDVMWDGEMVDIFHYHATWEYPYTIGCYRGTPVTLPR